MDLVKMAGSYVLARLQEASTWASIAAWGGAEIGIHASPDLNTALIHLGVAGAAALGVFIKEKGWLK